MPVHNRDKLGLLKERIRQAFPSTFDLAHEDCVGLRTKLVSLYPEDVLLVLGPVLIDLLDTHNSSGSDCVDSVVRFLCGACLPPLADTSGLQKCKSELDTFATTYCREAIELFEHLTKAQANALYEWLLVVQSWGGHDVDEEELAAALNYWNLRG